MYDFREPVIPGTPVVLTAGQVAQVLRVSLRTVQRITASGALPHRTIGERAVRYTVADIDTYLAGARSAPPENQVSAQVVGPAKRTGRPARLVGSPAR